MAKNPLYEELLDRIEKSKHDLVDLCLNLGNIPSYHGKERKLGEAVLAWLNHCGIDGELQSITAESVNAIAILKGAGTGKSLIWNAHMDTGPELTPDASEAEKKLDTAWIDGDMLFGKGMINDKAQLCAFMIALRAIKEAVKMGIELLGKERPAKASGDPKDYVDMTLMAELEKSGFLQTVYK